VRPSDKRAALDPLRQQLQSAIRDCASELAEVSERVANSRTWGGLPEAARKFRTLVDGDPRQMPDRLGEAYALMLRLGRFLETDVRLQRHQIGADEPLAADIQGPLRDLVQMAAPWLRGFPTVSAWDDAAGRTLVRTELFKPARDFTRVARDEQMISQWDATRKRSVTSACRSALVGAMIGACERQQGKCPLTA
jgi:hypothetical protein